MKSPVRRRSALSASGAPLLLLASGLLLASSQPAAAKEWVATVGGRVTSSPPYEGAAKYRVRASPTLAIRAADRPYRFSPSDGGASIALIDTDHFSAGPIVRFRYKREAIQKLAGLREIKWAAEPGGFVEVWPTQWLRGRAELRHGVGGHHGVVAELGGDLIYTGAGRWDVSIGPRLGWGDQKYLRRYFGVNAAEAAASPLVARPYEPTAGRRYTGVEVASAYHLTPAWAVKGAVGYRSLADKAAASPVVQVAGKSSQILASVGVSYSFGMRL